jgi:hypothetical protein
MMERLLVWGIRRYVGGPGRSWLFTGLGLVAYRAVRSRTGRQRLVETMKLAPGSALVMEHLDETHEEQLRRERRERRTKRRQRRRARAASVRRVAGRAGRRLSSTSRDGH